MSSAHRRSRLLGWLRHRGTVTGEEAAAFLGVSLRTLRRDVAALRDEGIVIEGEVGPGGGLRLDPRAPLPAVHFEVDEAIGLFLSLELARVALGFPFAGAADTALAKIVTALRPALADDLRRLMRRVVVGAPASPAVIASLQPVSPSLVGVFERAFRHQCALGFDYVDRHGQRSRRRVEPHGLLLQNPAWYVLGIDVDRDAARMFRFDRASNPRLVEAHTFVPRPLSVFDDLLVPEVFAGTPTSRKPS